jgi:hypothetical protein
VLAPAAADGTQDVGLSLPGGFRLVTWLSSCHQLAFLLQNNVSEKCASPARMGSVSFPALTPHARIPVTGRQHGAERGSNGPRCSGTKVECEGKF